MTAPTFVAGQMVRIDAPGLAGHGKRGMVSHVMGYGTVVTFPVHCEACISQPFHADQLRDAEHEMPEIEPGSVTLDYSGIPDPRIAIATALLVAMVARGDHENVSGNANTGDMRDATKLATIGATELVAQLNKG